MRKKTFDFTNSLNKFSKTMIYPLGLKFSDRPRVQVKERNKINK